MPRKRLRMGKPFSPDRMDYLTKRPHVDAEIACDENITYVGASAKKISSHHQLLTTSDSEDDFGEEEGPVTASGNMIWGVAELVQSLRDNAVCSSCLAGNLSLIEYCDGRNGWGTSVAWLCSNTECSKSTGLELNKYPTSQQQQDRCYSINKALVLGMRAIGKGRSSAFKLAAYLDLPAPVASQHWRKHCKFIAEQTTNSAETAMGEAAIRLKRLKLQTTDVDELNASVVDCAVSVDGSWLNRGFYSRHAFVGVISIDTGECLDRIMMCSTCNACKQWDGASKSSPEYMEFYVNHFIDCPLNHEGSSQAMEPEGVERLFCRSEEKYGLRYTTFVGDGDSKSYQQVVQAEPYGPDVTITKEECIGHIQKRMGSRLRSLVNRTRGSKLSDGKSLQGKGRLTQKRIDSFQVFYGMVLRSNRRDVDAMSRSTKAILFHYSDKPDETRHRDCPDGRTSWCKWKTDQATGDLTYHPPKHPLSEAIVEELMPVFNSLSDPRLLRSCLMGLSQNANESLHHTIWTYVPKDQFHSPLEVQLGIDMAVMTFNQGAALSNKCIFDTIRLYLPSRSLQYFMQIDKKRIQECSRKSSKEAKLSRKARRHEKLKQLDAFEKDEKITYRSGAFHFYGDTSSTTRRCRQCGNPMKGHQRGICVS